MRVLHVINSLSASGGAEHGLVREVRLFSDEVEQRVVRLFSQSELDSQLEAAGIDVLPLGLDRTRAGRNWPLATRKIGEIIREFRPDVIHSSLFSANLAAQLAARLAGVPILSTFTLSGDEDLLTRYQPGAASWKASVLRFLASRSARNRLVSFRALTTDALRTNCSLLGVDPSRAHVIPRGIPTGLRPDQIKPRSELGVPEDVPLLVNIGRQTAQKGHLSLTRALYLVRKATPAHLVIVGREGDTTPDLKAAIEDSGLQGHVTLTGYTQDVFHYLAHASLFVFPSYMEGLGTAVLEAMSFGLPVVAFDIPPVREVTDDGRLARLVPSGDVEGLASEILMALDGRGEQNHEAEKWVAENFRIESVARRLENLLRTVATAHV